MSPLLLAEGLALGAAIGLVLGTVGAGGAILAAPGLILVLGVPHLAATTSSLVIVVAAAIAGVAPRLRSGTVNARLGLTFAAIGAGGTVAGSLVAEAIPEPVTIGLFAALMYSAAWLMWRERPDDERMARPGRLLVFATASGVGLLTGLLGIGGGFLIVPALVLILGVRPHIAAGTSLVAIAAGGLIALVARYPTWPEVPWPIVVVVGIAAITTALATAPLAQRLPARTLRRLFAGVVVAVATVLVGSLFG